MFGETIIDFIIGLSAVLIGIYIYDVYKHSYWKRRNIPGPKPVPIFGNFMEQILGKSSVHEKFRDLYLIWKNEPFIGIYISIHPCLLINDPELIKQILVKDFNDFPQRGFLFNEKVDPLSANLLTIDDHRWKVLRNKLTPFFTPAKLKQMYSKLKNCANNFDKYIEKIVANNETIDVKEITAKFTTDVVGSSAFGLNLKALSNEESSFRKMAQNVLEQNFMNVFREGIKNLMPCIFKLLNIRLISKETTDFFMGSMTEAIEYRKKNGVIRNDLIDLITELKENPVGIDFGMV